MISEDVSTMIIGMNFGAFTRFFKVFSEGGASEGRQSKLALTSGWRRFSGGRTGD